MAEDGPNACLQDLERWCGVLHRTGKELLRFGLAERPQAAVDLDSGAENETEDDVEAADSEKEPGADERELINVMAENTRRGDPLDGAEDANTKVRPKDG